MSVGAYPRSSPYLDAASPRGTAFFLLIPIFCLYTAHMCSIVKHLSRHIYPRDAVRRVLSWHQLLPPTNPGTPVTPCSIPWLGRLMARYLKGTFPQAPRLEPDLRLSPHPAQHFQIRLGLRSVAWSTYELEVVHAICLFRIFELGPR